jgi:hypothetical protein
MQTIKASTERELNELGITTSWEGLAQVSGGNQ